MPRTKQPPRQALRVSDGITPGDPCPEESLRQAETLLGMALPKSLLRLLAEGDGRFKSTGPVGYLGRRRNRNMFCLELQGDEGRVIRGAGSTPAWRR